MASVGNAVYEEKRMRGPKRAIFVILQQCLSVGRALGRVGLNQAWGLNRRGGETCQPDFNKRGGWKNNVVDGKKSKNYLPCMHVYSGLKSTYYWDG